jgi:hypothetical protein
MTTNEMLNEIMAIKIKLVNCESTIKQTELLVALLALQDSLIQVLVNKRQKTA